MFDPEVFGRAMGEAIRKAVEPLQAKIAQMEKDLEGMAAQLQSEIVAFNAEPIPGPAGANGKDCDMEAVKAMIAEAVKAIPVINGKDGQDGKPGKDGPAGRDGQDGAPGARGEKGADGAGLAGAMIDRDGNLVATLSNGEVKILGPVVGKDGKDGIDGIGLDSFEMEYIPEAHEISIKASAAGRVKELRYPAGGIRPGGYWRDGTRAKAAEAWIHDGSLWIATKDTSTKPETVGSDWIIAARKGRDGERGQKGQDGSPPAPIKLGS